MNEKEKFDKLKLEELRTQLEFFRQLGVDFLVEPHRQPAERPIDNSSRPELISGEHFQGSEGDQQAEWDRLIQKILNCRFCPLFKTRTQAVPGEGNRKAQLMFVGEAPGRDEDLQGRPFVGRAGQLLTKIIQSMGFPREEVYIANVIKCRPPENRTPRPDEIKVCSHFLLKQIEMIRPRVIVTLGKVATEFLLQSSRSMSELRGHFGEFQRIPVMPTFHPAYLVRNERNKQIRKMVWEDMKQVMKLLKS